MRKPFLNAIILGLGTCFLAAGNPAQEVSKAVKDLKSPDLLVVRAAIRKLGELSKVPNVHSAVKPLTKILNQEGRPFDSYTRTLAERSLGLIAREAAGKSGLKIMTPIVETLFNDSSDFVKVGASEALAIAGYSLFLDPLEISAKTDPSPVVREASSRAFVILANSTGESSVMRSLSTSASSPSGSPSAAMVTPAGQSPCLSDDMYLWMKNHLILFNPQLNLEELRCPANPPVSQ